MEGLDEREPVEWDEIDQVIDSRVSGVYLQAYNARKGHSPSAVLRIHGSDGLGELDEKRSAVVLMQLAILLCTVNYCSPSNKSQRVE